MIPSPSDLASLLVGAIPVLLLSCQAVPDPVSAPRRPNVILILADDMGYADINAFGGKFGYTPNLDALAAAGTRLSQSYAACAVCSWSCASSTPTPGEPDAPMGGAVTGATEPEERADRRPDNLFDHLYLPMTPSGVAAERWQFLVERGTLTELWPSHVRCGTDTRWVNIGPGGTGDACTGIIIPSHPDDRHRALTKTNKPAIPETIAGSSFASKSGNCTQTLNQGTTGTISNHPLQGITDQPGIGVLLLATELC